MNAATVIRTGGIGSTCAALEAAAGLEDHRDDGVWFVNLAPLNDVALVSSTVASALGLRIPGAVRQWLRSSPRRGGSIRSSCSTIASTSSGAAEVPEALVLGCPHARLLVTSREPLKISGERRVPLAVVGRTTGAIGESDPAAAESSALLTATLQIQLRPEVLFALQAAGAQLELDHAVDKALAASRST